MAIKNIEMRYVNTPIEVDGESKQTLRIRTLQMRVIFTVPGGDMSTPWETIPEFDAEDIEAEEESERKTNATKSVEDLGL